MIGSLLGFFRDRSSSTLSKSRHRSTLTPCHCRLMCLLMVNHVLVQQTSMLQTGGVTSQVDIATMGMVVMTHLVRVVRAQLWLHDQKMRVMVEMMMMCDHCFHRQLQPLCALFDLLAIFCGDR